MTTATDDEGFAGWNSTSVIVVTVVAVSVYNAVELLAIVASRFEGRRSLLSVSLTVASAGIIPYTTGFLLEFFRAAPFWAAMTLSSIGWVCLITGQSVVLYSRLGLILDNDKILKAVKWMIIVDAVLFHTSTTIIQYCKSYGGLQAVFSRAMYYIEKIQMTGFCLQEMIISGLYLWKTVELLGIIKRKGSRTIMIELFIINIFLVMGDIALLVLEYSGRRVMERTWKCFIYSIKLKLEFAVLSKLINLVQASQRAMSAALSDVDAIVHTNPSTIDDRSHKSAIRPQKPSKKDRIPRWLSKLERRDTQVPCSAHVEHIQQTNLKQ